MVPDELARMERVPAKAKTLPAKKSTAK